MNEEQDAAETRVLIKAIPTAAEVRRYMTDIVSLAIYKNGCKI